MRSQGVYTTPGPRKSWAPHGLPLFLALLLLGIAVVTIVLALTRAGPQAPPQAQAPAAAQVRNQFWPRNRIFADEILGAQQLALSERGTLSVPMAIQPVVYNLPKPIPSLWRTCRACADEALGELRMPAPKPIVMRALLNQSVRYPLIPDTRALYARNRIFADEVLGSLGYNLAVPDTSWSPAEVTPRTGPR